MVNIQYMEHFSDTICNPKNSCGAPGVSKPKRSWSFPRLPSETGRVASDVMMTSNQLTEATVSTEAGGQNWRMVLVDDGTTYQPQLVQDSSNIVCQSWSPFI